MSKGKIMGLVVGLVLVIVVAVLLFGGESDEEKAYNREREEMTILYGYEEDKVRPVVAKEKTVDELVEEIVYAELKIDDGSAGYKEYGVLKNQGIIIESALYSGGDLPQVSALSKELITETGETMQDKLRAEQVQEFYYRIQDNLSEKLNKRYEEESSDSEKLLAELKARLEKQEQQLESQGSAVQNDGEFVDNYEYKSEE